MWTKRDGAGYTIISVLHKNDESKDAEEGDTEGEADAERQKEREGDEQGDEDEGRTAKETERAKKEQNTMQENVAIAEK